MIPNIQFEEIHSRYFVANYSPGGLVEPIFIELTGFAGTQDWSVEFDGELVAEVIDGGLTCAVIACYQLLGASTQQIFEIIHLPL